MAHIDGFTEPDDVGAELGAAFWAAITPLNGLGDWGFEVAAKVRVAISEDVVMAFALLHIGASVQMPDMLAAGLFEKAIDILGNVDDLIFLFQRCDSVVCGVRFAGLIGAEASSVEVEHKLRIALPAFGCRNIFDGVIFP